MTNAGVNGYPSPVSFASKADPLGLGYPTTVQPELVAAQSSVASSNRIHYRRVRGGGSVSKLRVQVANQSGNYCLSIYRNSGSGLTAVPGNLVVTTGSLSVPGTGQVDVQLPGSYTITHGDFWFALAADNTTAQFGAYATNGWITDGWGGYQDSAFAAPSVPSMTLDGNRYFLIVGVP